MKQKTQGLSPRVRGNRRVILVPIGLNGSIPRACGGTTGGLFLLAGSTGLSPRVRGNLVVVMVMGISLGSIPARAGEPHEQDHEGRPTGVYPRACGGTPVYPRRRDVYRGLSPRVRGNPDPSDAPGAFRGSIPARAGEPRSGAAHTAARWVYPRACGGTPHGSRAWCSRPGLSPRVRGNRLEPEREDPPEGSIPARAGEPGPRSRSSPAGRVYPRACGGTRSSPATLCRSAGLSPRVRGNPRRERDDRAAAGSIPARAGEPGRGRGTARSPQVYPRACGGTRRRRR